MNIAQTASETTEVKSQGAPEGTFLTTTIYVNLDFPKLANDIKDGTLAHQFNGKGRRIAIIPEDKEKDYLSYTAEPASSPIFPPFEINNGDNIEFILQAGGAEKTRFKWKGIIQNNYDLQLVSTEKRSATYKAVVAKATPGTSKTDEDDVIINVNFKSGGDKFTVAWDPKVKIKRT